MSDLLIELVNRCEAAGVRVDAYIVGGAALTLQLGRPRSTPDIDVLLNPPSELVEVAQQMAADMGFPSNWLNSRAFSYLGGLDPDGDTDAVELDFPGHRVRVASPRYLLAMKLAAMRAKDLDDAAACIRALDLHDPEAIADDAISILGEDSMAWGHPHDVDLRTELVMEAKRVVARAWSDRELWEGSPRVEVAVLTRERQK